MPGLLQWLHAGTGRRRVGMDRRLFVFQAHFLKKLSLLLCRLLSLLRFCTRMGGICDVFNHTKMWEQVKVLEDQTILALDLF